MARMRSKMRTVESTTVSAMRSTRRELAKVARATGRTSAVAMVGQVVELVGGDGGFGERGGDGPGFGDVVGLEPAGAGRSRGRSRRGDRWRRRRGWRSRPCVLRVREIQARYWRRLGVGETEVAETILLVAVLAQLGEEAGGGALGGGGGVVELVGEVGGELAEGGELLGLLLHAGDLADAVEQGGDAALRHRRDGGEHLGEEGLVEVERPGGADGEAVSAVGLHAGEGKLAGHLAGAADQEGWGWRGGGGRGSRPEDEVEAVAGVAFEEDDGAVIADGLVAVGGEPGVLLFGEAVEGSDGAQSGDDVRKGCGPRGRADEYLRLYLIEWKSCFVATLGCQLEPPSAGWHRWGWR